MTYVLANLDRLLLLTWQHVEISASAVLLATAIGVPVGVLISRVASLARPVLVLAGILYTVPSLALFAVLIPVLGLGTRSAVVALVLYSLLVLIRNTATGLAMVQPEVVEAAAGMGMSGRQRLWLVELPLALPMIMGGVRIATVMNIGITSIAAYIGAGGLGVLIFRGIATVDAELILAGAVPIALLAVTADRLLRQMEWLLRPGARSFRVVAGPRR